LPGIEASRPRAATSKGTRSGLVRRKKLDDSDGFSRVAVERRVSDGPGPSWVHEQRASSKSAQRATQRYTGPRSGSSAWRSTNPRPPEQPGNATCGARRLRDQPGVQGRQAGPAGGRLDSIQRGLRPALKKGLTPARNEARGPPQATITTATACDRGANPGGCLWSNDRRPVVGDSRGAFDSRVPWEVAWVRCIANERRGRVVESFRSQGARKARRGGVSAPTTVHAQLTTARGNEGEKALFDARPSFRMTVRVS